MSATHHRTERLNIINAANALRMSVPALGERIQRGDVQTEYIAGYTFIRLGEIDRFAAALAEEAREAQAAEDERRAEEQRERDGQHIVREIGHLRELAESYGFTSPAED